jgi:hypothetical protein
MLVHSLLLIPDPLGDGLGHETGREFLPGLPGRFDISGLETLFRSLFTSVELLPARGLPFRLPGFDCVLGLHGVDRALSALFDFLELADDFLELGRVLLRVGLGVGEHLG